MHTCTPLRNRAALDATTSCSRCGINVTILMKPDRDEREPAPEEFNREAYPRHCLVRPSPERNQRRGDRAIFGSGPCLINAAFEAQGGGI